MSLRNRLVLPIALFSLAALAGCGSGNKATPPPGGSFSDSNLKGTYVFSVTGADVNNNFLTIAGTFTADGSGGISGGTIDLNDPATGVIPNQTITTGSYNVGVDGRAKNAAGVLTLQTAAGTYGLAFVLTSSEHGLITEFDGSGSGSGSLDLQTSTSQPAAGTYVFGLSGISGISGLTGLQVPAATAGAITLDGTGNTTGSMDYNSNETVSPFTINAGSLVSVSGTPGTATLVTSGGTIHFDVYPIDSTHMKVIETDTFPILAGDVFSQTSSNFPSGQIVFTMAGMDYDSTVGGPLAVGGLMTSDGSSTISNGEEDYDDAGFIDTSAPQTFSGTITPSSGRFLLQLNTFENGNANVIGTFTFAAYPSSGGIELVEIDSNGITSGVAFAQTGTALQATQGYGMNLAAVNSSSFEDDIAEFTTTSNKFSGLIDINDQGLQSSFGQGLTGSYTADSPATGRGVITSGAFNGAYYTVDNSNALFLETDSNQLGVGALQIQTASAMSNLTASHLAMLRLKPGAKKAWRRR
jgi:hypothetical protein